jgi:NTP pyrophosphatase (non-canonical NTP hydrolase)
MNTDRTIKFSSIVERIAKLCDVDPTPNANKLAYMMEEVGEVALSLNVEQGFKKREVKESSEQESCDVILAALWIILQNKDWDKERILSYIDTKLRKWEKKYEQQ